MLDMCDMILLSEKEILPNFRLLYDFFNLWNTLANAFCLPFSMMSPTLLEVIDIVGLPMDENKVPYLHDVLGTDLCFSSQHLQQGSDPVGETEHKAFLLF